MRTQEEAVLFAALEEDYLEVKRRLLGFLPGERATLLRACDLIREGCDIIQPSPVTMRGMRSD